jgi:Tissue inhibitor of metalloproteinase
MVSVSFAIGCLVFLPALVVSCDCFPMSVQRSFTLVDTVFTGRVERRLPNVEWDAVYIVKVDNVHKGCSVTASNHVIVRTARESSLCGVTFNVNTSYLFSGSNSSISDGIRQQIGNIDSTCQAVRVGLCTVNVPWMSISTETLQALNQLNTSQCSTTSTTCLINVPNQSPTRAPMSVRAPSKAPLEMAAAPTTRGPNAGDAPMFGRLVPTAVPVAAPKASPMLGPSKAPLRTDPSEPCGFFGWRMFCPRRYCRLLGSLIRSCRKNQ